MHAGPLLFLMVTTVGITMWRIVPQRLASCAIQHQRDLPQQKTCGQGEVCVLSWSVYGDFPKYVVGMDRNAALAASVYPGWSVRVYHDGNVPYVHRRRWRQLGAQLFLRNTSQSNSGMFWRFEVAADPGVDRFLIRDSDSRLSAREARATDLWIASGHPYFIIRDHVAHSDWPINGGMWGGTLDASIPWSRLLSQAYREYYLADMKFLRDAIYPRIWNQTFEVDSWSCNTCQRCRKQWPRAVAFPTHRAGWEHVGARFDDHERPYQSDIDTLLQAPVDHGCVPPLATIDDGVVANW